MNKRRHSGIALPAILWLVALLAVLATGYAYNVRTDTQLTRNWLDSARVRAAADAGIAMAVMEQLEPDDEDSPADGSPQEIEFEGISLRLAILNEIGRIDLNTAPADLLDQVFRYHGVADDERAALVGAILDWRDEDKLVQLNGAEDADYARAGLKYGAKDAPFTHVDELSLVLGMTPELFAKVGALLTVHSGAKGINPRYAPKAVLLALPGVDEAWVDAYLEQRADGSIVAPIVLPGGGEQYLVDGSGKNYLVEVEATLPNGASERLSAIVNLTASGRRPYSILSWSEAAALNLVTSVDDEYSEQ